MESLPWACTTTGNSPAIQWEVAIFERNPYCHFNNREGMHSLNTDRYMRLLSPSVLLKVPT